MKTTAKFFNPENLYGDSRTQIREKLNGLKGNENLYFANGVHNETTGQTTYQIYDGATGGRVGEAIISPNDKEVTGYEGKFRCEINLNQDMEF